MADADARWKDNPFWQPETPEQKEWSDKVTEALRIYRETGDDSMAVEIGLFPAESEDEGDSEVHKVAALLDEVQERQTT